MLHRVAVLGLVALVGLVAYAGDDTEPEKVETVAKNDPNQGHGLLLRATESEDYPKNENWEKFQPKDIDFGKNLDSKEARVWEVFITYALPANPKAKKDAEKGWTAQEPQRAAILRGISLSEKQVRGSQEPGFYVGLYRPRMNDDAVKQAKKLGEQVKILKIEIKETDRRPDGSFENQQVFADPNPVLIRKVGAIAAEGGNEFFLYVKAIGPDSKEGKEEAEKETEETGAKKSETRKFRAHLEIRKEIKRRPDGTWGEPGEGDKPAQDDNAGK